MILILTSGSYSFPLAKLLCIFTVINSILYTLPFDKKCAHLLITYIPILLLNFFFYRLLPSRQTPPPFYHLFCTTLAILSFLTLSINCTFNIICLDKQSFLQYPFDILNIVHIIYLYFLYKNTDDHKLIFSHQI